jgi:hypothetical protein
MYPYSVKSTVVKWLFAFSALGTLLFVLGIRISHPHDGLKNALGSARSGLVVYQTKPALVVQEKVLVHVHDKARDPILAFIVANNGKTIDVQSGASAFTVQSKQVYGKLILVMPFLGSILGSIGL